MDSLIPLMSLISLIVSVALSRKVTYWLINRLARETGNTGHSPATGIAIAVVFAVVFIVIWTSASLLLVLPLMLIREQ